MDHLTLAVKEVLSSGYCPANERFFLLQLAGAVLGLVAVACAIFVIARLPNQNAAFKAAANTWAWTLVIFAVGGCALELFGLFGCTGNAP